jgi:kynurenine formamidase
MKLFLDEFRFIDTGKPLDLSIQLSNDTMNPRAWYVEPPVFEPVRTQHYTGSVAEGGSVNFRNIFFNPHGHGTHTECLGHITKEIYSVNDVVKEYFCEAQVLTIEPVEITNESDGSLDRVVTASQLTTISSDVEALIIRTLPNRLAKKSLNYSETNPPYLDLAGAKILIEKGIKHLLLDLPSVDRESDCGELVFHHAFWEVPDKPNHERTITELIFVRNEIEDGKYILELQVAPFKNDAAPSRPILYKIEKS